MTFNRLPPLTDPPSDDTPLAEGWLRPLSAACDTRPHATHYSSMEPRSGLAQVNPYGRKGMPPGNAAGAQRKKWSKLTDEKRARIIEGIKAGNLYREIALELGVGQSTVDRIAAAEGIGRGQGRQGTGSDPCDTCGGPLGVQNQSGTCKRCQRGERR